MDLPIELYIEMYNMTNDVNVTKSLRAVNKTTLKACNEYHKSLLKTHKTISFILDKWIIGDEKYDPNKWYSMTLGGDYFAELTAFKMTIKDLYLIKPMVS